MSDRPITEEQYRKGSDVINFVVYNSTTGVGEDEVLQHKLIGTTETAHVTLHPDGKVNFRTKRNKEPLKAAILTGLVGYTPEPSTKVKEFISKVRTKI